MIEFKVEIVLEDDDHSWENLLVKTPDKDWHSASITYGTESEIEIRSIIRNQNFCNNVLTNFREFLKTKGFDLKVSHCDYISDMDSHWGVDFGGVTVIADSKFKEFEVGYETYDSGSYWEPPSTDHCEYSKHKSLIKALFDAYALLLTDEYDCWTSNQLATHL